MCNYFCVVMCKKIVAMFKKMLWQYAKKMWPCAKQVWQCAKTIVCGHLKNIFLVMCQEQVLWQHAKTKFCGSVQTKICGNVQTCFGRVRINVGGHVQKKMW